MTARVTKNQLRDDRVSPKPPPAIADYHHRMPAYSPTSLLDAPDLAESLGFAGLREERIVGGEIGEGFEG